MDGYVLKCKCRPDLGPGGLKESILEVQLGTAACSAHDDVVRKWKSSASRMDNNQSPSGGSAGL